MANRVVTFHADSLASKWGFEDGDILGEFDLPNSVDEHALLIRLVRAHLLPLLNPRLEVIEIGTCHNPIRALGEIWWMYCEDSYVTVEITEAMVQEALNVGQ